MNQLLLGTRNAGKIAELKHLLRDANALKILSLSDVPFTEVDETGTTFLENALLKAKGICDETGLAVFAEDAGLEVLALDGAPGVYSARYAGIPVDYAANNELLLQRMKGVPDRRAQFVAVAALRLPDGHVFVTTGMLRGTIALDLSGAGGFGYDPLFRPEGRESTLAELSMDEKNLISHRMKALSRMLPIVNELAAAGELRCA